VCSPSPLQRKLNIFPADLMPEMAGVILTAILVGGGVCRGEAIPVWFTEMKDGGDPKSCPVEGDDPRIASPSGEVSGYSDPWDQFQANIDR